MRRPLFFWSFCLGALLAFVYCRWPDPQGDGPPDGTRVIVTGQVCDRDETSFVLKIDHFVISNSTNLDAAVLQQNNPSNDFHNFIAEIWAEINECHKLFVAYDDSQNIMLGSEVMLEGEFCVFSQATNPGEFDFACYYRSMGYLGRLCNVQVLGQNGESELLEGLYSLRCFWEERLYQIYPPKEASVMAAILLGEKGNVDEAIRALYERNGIVHILSISGLHITLVGMGIYKLLRKLGLPVWAAALWGAAVLVLYGVMTGLGVSVCRAIGMYLLRMLGYLWGRTYDMLTALGLVGAVMALIHPPLLGHMGYLLSFGSVVGIGVLLPALSGEIVVPEQGQGCSRAERIRTGKPERFVEGRLPRVLLKVWKFVSGVLREGLLAGVSITLTTLPIQLWFRYEISIYSVFLNALILPLMGVVMITGLMAMMVPGLGAIGTADVIILSGYEGLCHVFESLPGAMWNPGRPAVWQVAMYYLLWIAAVWLLPRLRTRLLHPVQLVCLSVAVGILALPCFSGDRVTFLDVGQGDCICVQLSSGEVYVFDCGSSSRPGIGADVLMPFLKYYGISEINALFASHGDADHTNGLEELLELAKQEHISVNQLVLPRMDVGLLMEEFGGLLAAAEGAGVSVSTIAAGEGWGCGEVSADGRQEALFLCLHPASDASSADGAFPDASAGSNAGSECFYVELREGVQRLTFLLTGDVEGDGERQLTSRLIECGIAEVAVLKVGHHGSKNSSSEAFLAQVNPRVAIISCGRNNPYGHPHEETLKRLRETGGQVIGTPECGAITIEIGEEMVVRSWLLSD